MNRGEIVELVIRRNNLSISELSRRLHVSRRSIYNWFEQADLSFDVIFKIGEVLDYDFSVDFPEVFNKRQVKLFEKTNYEIQEENDLKSVNYWKNKYISLLEKHNEILSDHSPVAQFVLR